jgi:hypothetical protein
MKIKFTPHVDTDAIYSAKPEASIKHLPSWYKRKKPTFNNEPVKIMPNGTSNITVKWCNPFGDALSAGYYILLNYDLQVTKSEGDSHFVWKTGGSDFVSTHSVEQVAPELIPKGFNNQPYKFLNNWRVTTPKGWSCIFTHPLNRPELPFHSLAGVVETDRYNLPVNFPFLIRDDFEGVIESGTPIIQIIPFKRASWISAVLRYDEKQSTKNLSFLNSKISRAYKSFFWVRKSYK